mmetsp:Transcript_29000/g.31193  ORF Transcript_29000/g.31193 Transcript_29000/m.31193 type:complete len:770 (+) Transcript_29000:73-2382(+)
MITTTRGNTNYRCCKPTVVLLIFFFVQQCSSMINNKIHFSDSINNLHEVPPRFISMPGIDRRHYFFRIYANTQTSDRGIFGDGVTAIIDDKSGNRRVNNPVKSIMLILVERYDLPPSPSPTTTKGTAENIQTYDCDSDDDHHQHDGNRNKNNKRNATNEWKKTRNYLYHANRSHRQIQGNRDDEEGDGDCNDDNTGDACDTLTLQQQVINVVNFLDGRLKLPRQVSRKILQDSPRILRKPVNSFLIPTSDFLLELWGRDLFLLAVERNPALLLSSGVGYTTNRKTKKKKTTYTKNSIDDEDEDGNNSISKAGLNLENAECILFKYTGLSSSTVKRIKKSSPFVFGLAPSQLHSVLSYLKDVLIQREVDTTKTEVTKKQELIKAKNILGKIVAAHPNLLNLSVEKNLKPRMEFLVTSCDLNATQLAKVVEISNGSVLGLSVKQNLKPTMNYLLRDIFHDGEMNNTEKRILLKNCLLVHPQIVGLSLTNLRSKAEYFHTIGPSLAIRIATKCPVIYSLNLDQNIIPTVEFLTKVWGMTTNETTQLPSSTKDRSLSSDKKNNNSSSSSHLLQNMFHEYPNIITLSVETNIKPTMMFFNKTGYTLLNENWELMLSDNIGGNNLQFRTNNNDDDLFQKIGRRTLPNNRIRGRYIAASLYNRLLPRWHFCLSSSSSNNFDENNNSILVDKNATLQETFTTSSSSAAAALKTTTTVISQSKIPPLHLLVMSSDEAFCEALGFRLESYTQFKNESIPRLKFSSQFDIWLKTGKPIDL